MPSIFISHSSRDNPHALALDGWLRSRGHEEIFLDVHRDDGIAIGTNWKGELAAAMQRCHVVLALVTEHWFRSPWCQAEQAAATMLGKPVIPLLIEAADASKWAQLCQSLRERFGDVQYADLTRDREDGLARLEAVLGRSQVTPAAFPVPPGTPPYRGLSAYGEPECGLYFGRSAEIQSCLEAVRAMAADGAARRTLVLLGASGAGKSSLLHAGLWPQFGLRPREFLALPPVTLARDPQGLRRPAGALLDALSAAFLARGVPFDRADCERRQAAGKPALADTLERLRTHAGSPGAAVVLGLDQVEVVLQDDAAAQAEFASSLRAFLALPRCLLVLAMRSDTFDSVMEQRLLEGIDCSVHPLAPIPLSRIGDVITGPAGRVGLEIEPALVDQVIRDAGTGDALPLLSFTLENLWRRHGASGRLMLAQYEERSGQAEGRRISPIENSVRLAAREAVGALDPVEAEALFDAFVPGLVDLTDGGEVVRRRGAWSAMPARAVPVLRRLEAARLLSSDAGGALEVTHEALLRRWDLLAERIEQARPDLRLLKDVERAAFDWAQAASAPGDQASAELRHTGQRLRRARALARRPAWRQRLGERGLAYLAACTAASRRWPRRVAAAAAAAALLLVVGLLYLRSDHHALTRMLANGPGPEEGFRPDPGRFAVLAAAGRDAQIDAEWQALPERDQAAGQRALCNAAQAALGSGRPAQAQALVERLLGASALVRTLADDDQRVLAGGERRAEACLDMAFAIGLGPRALDIVRQVVAAEGPKGAFMAPSVLHWLDHAALVRSSDAEFAALLDLAVGHAHPRWGLRALARTVRMAPPARAGQVGAAVSRWMSAHEAMRCGRGRNEDAMTSGDVDNPTVAEAVASLRERGLDAQADALATFVCEGEQPAGSPPELPPTWIAGWRAEVRRSPWLQWASFDRRPDAAPRTREGRCEALVQLLGGQGRWGAPVFDDLAALATLLQPTECDSAVIDWARESLASHRLLGTLTDRNLPIGLVRRVRHALDAAWLGAPARQELYRAMHGVLTGAPRISVPLVERLGTAPDGAPRPPPPGTKSTWVDPRDAQVCEFRDPAIAQVLAGAADSAAAAVRAAERRHADDPRGPKLGSGGLACLVHGLLAIDDAPAARALAMREERSDARNELLRAIAIDLTLRGRQHAAWDVSQALSTPTLQRQLQTDMLVIRFELR